MIYRAPARVCNGCVLKPACTHSDRGRGIVALSDSWLESHIGRFHRGLSLSLCVLAGFHLLGKFFGTGRLQSVARRTPEIGVRLALGARQPELMAMVFREGMLPAVSGLALAWDWTCDTINTTA